MATSQGPRHLTDSTPPLGMTTSMLSRRQRDPSPQVNVCLPGDSGTNCLPQRIFVSPIPSTERRGSGQEDGRPQRKERSRRSTPGSFGLPRILQRVSVWPNSRSEGEMPRPGARVAGPALTGLGKEQLYLTGRTKPADPEMSGRTLAIAQVETQEFGAPRKHRLPRLNCLSGSGLRLQSFGLPGAVSSSQRRSASISATEAVSQSFPKDLVSRGFISLNRRATHNIPHWSPTA